MDRHCNGKRTSGVDGHCNASRFAVGSRCTQSQPVYCEAIWIPRPCLAFADSAFTRPNVRAPTAPRTRSRLRLKGLLFLGKMGTDLKSARGERHRDLRDGPGV